MIIFLGFLMLLMVSGDTNDNVKGFLTESVLLPCSCGDRISDEEPRWQKEPGINLKNSHSYAGRIQLFPNDRYNCSILLKNITEDDHGTYRCIYKQKVYKHTLVHLTVCGPFQPSQDSFIDHNGMRTFRCKVKSCNNETELQWTLNENILENSSKYQISSNRTESDGIFHFTNTLRVTESNEISSTSDLKCNFSSPNLERVIREEDNSKTISLTIIFVGFILGVGLLLVWYYHRKKICRKRQSKEII